MINYNNVELVELNSEELENVTGGESGWYYLGKAFKALAEWGQSVPPNLYYY